MRNKKAARIFSFALACLLAGTCIPAEAFATEVKEEAPLAASEAAEEETVEKAEDKEAKENKISKDETVYVNLNADGSVRDIIITDKIHSDDPSAVIEDKTNLTDLEVIKGGSIKEQKDGTILWQMEAKDLYYRGKSAKKLPFDISIKYFLDGKEMKISKIAGKSGDLKITVDFKNNMSEKKDLNGRNTEFFSPMAVAALFSLPTDTFMNVEGDDVAISTEGDNTIVAVACVPGLDESLDLDNNRFEEIEDITLPNHFEITCKVENFKMGEIALTATGGFPEDDEDDKFDLDFIDELDENLQKVKRITNNFKKMDDDRALRDSLVDDKILRDIQAMASDVDKLLNMNTDLADHLDDYITKETVDSLIDILDELEEVDIRYLKDFHYAEDYNDSHSGKQKNEQLGKGVEKALELFDTIDFNAINAAYAGQQELMKNASQLIPGCRQVLKMTMGGNEFADGIIDSLSMEEMLPVVAKITPQMLLEKSINDNYELQLAKKAEELGIPVEAVPAEVKQVIFTAVKEAVMTEMHESGMDEQVKQLYIAASKYVGMLEMMKPMEDATIELGHYPKDAYLHQMVHSARGLYDDFVELYPSISAIKNDLKKANLKESFKQSPEMIDILVRVKKILDENTDLTDSLRKLKDEENIIMLKDIASTLDEIDKDAIIDKYSDKMDKIQDMISRKDILKDMADERDVYTDKADGMDTSYKFILKTDEIELPEEEEEVAAEEEVSGLKKFFQNLFK